jgi:hypothetical protein
MLPPIARRKMQAWIRSRHLICAGNFFLFETLDYTAVERFEECVKSGSPGMRLVVREPIGQNPYWMSFSELMSNHNCIIGYNPRRDPQRA